MFGYDKPNEHDLLQFWPGAHSHSEYIEKIVSIAEKYRQEALNKGERKRERVLQERSQGGQRVQTRTNCCT